MAEPGMPPRALLAVCPRLSSLMWGESGLRVTKVLVRLVPTENLARKAKIPWSAS